MQRVFAQIEDYDPMSWNIQSFYTAFNEWHILATSKQKYLTTNMISNLIYLILENI